MNRLHSFITRHCLCRRRLAYNDTTINAFFSHQNHITQLVISFPFSVAAVSNRLLPVYKLVLLQVLAALCDVSSHIEEVHHGQAGRVVLRNTDRTEY